MTTVLAKARTVNLELMGVTLTRNSLEASDEDSLHRAGRALAAMDSCSQWWWGDYLLACERLNCKTILDSSQPDLHRSTIYSWVECSRFYPLARRHSELSFTHHAAAMYILGVEADPADALKWLNRAADQKWTVGDLREAMRKAKRSGENDPGPMRGIIRITDFVKISRWTAKIRVEELPAREVEELRSSTGPLFEFLCRIHQARFGA